MTKLLTFSEITNSRRNTLPNPKFTKRMTPFQRYLQGTVTCFLRQNWLTEQASVLCKALQGISIRFVNFGLERRLVKARLLWCKSLASLV